MKSLEYFVLTYQRSTGTATVVSSFKSRRDAIRARFEIEQRQDSPEDTEVVILGAESLSALAATHSRYFETSERLLQGLKTAI